MFMYQGKPLNEPGNVNFGNTDISKIGDGTVTGAIGALDSSVDKLNSKYEAIATGIYLYKQGDICCLHLNNVYGEAVANVVIPSEYRPERTIQSPLVYWSVDKYVPAMALLSVDGKITVVNNAGTNDTTLENIRGYIIWLLF